MEFLLSYFIIFFLKNTFLLFQFIIIYTLKIYIHCSGWSFEVFYKESNSIG